MDLFLTKLMYLNNILALLFIYTNGKFLYYMLAA